MNRLAEMLALYDKEMGPVPTSRVDSPNMTAAANAQLNNAYGSNARGARLTGAMAMMNEMDPRGGPVEKPNFFANTPQPQLPSYVQPQQFGQQSQPYQGQSTWQQEMEGRMQPPQQSRQGPDIQNYLARLMRGR
jgi:hypothetical protein